MDRIPEGVLKQLAERQAKDAAQRAMFGAARLPITFRSHGYRIVGVHDEIRWFPESRLFHDFLDDYSAMLLGYEWGQQQLTLPESERHPVLGWRAARSRLPTSAITRDADGNFSAHASAAMACWLRLGWDFFTTRDADLLTRDILQRLRSRDHFQGARHELAVVALFNRAGYDVKHVKAGKATKTPEFIGTHGTGLKLAVEAKARQRYGVLGSKIGPKPDDWRVADSYHLLKNAAAKMADDPLIAVIELNLPPSPMGQPQNWGEQVNGMLERLKSENSPVPDLMVFWSSCDYTLVTRLRRPCSRRSLPPIVKRHAFRQRWPIIYGPQWTSGSMSRRIGRSSPRMVVEIDIWRAARLLLRRHGYDAPLIAAQRRDALLAAGDLDGVAVWKRIISAIDELTRARADGERLN